MQSSLKLLNTQQRNQPCLPQPQHPGCTKEFISWQLPLTHPENVPDLLCLWGRGKYFISLLIINGSKWILDRQISLKSRNLKWIIYLYKHCMLKSRGKEKKKRKFNCLKLLWEKKKDRKKRKKSQWWNSASLLVWAQLIIHMRDVNRIWSDSMMEMWKEAWEQGERKWGVRSQFGRPGQRYTLLY